MRLLNVHDLTFREFFGNDRPEYAILSHRWGKNEVTYTNFLAKRSQDSAGYRKILNFCTLIRQWLDPQDKQSASHIGSSRHRISWVWIDTCCIDHDSSQEISEAINSIYNWYSEAAVCYVYMSDVPTQTSTSLDVFWKAFDTSDWFACGWTLQALLAPATVVFCDRQWTTFSLMQRPEGKHLYTTMAFSPKRMYEFVQRIASITHIQPAYLVGDAPIESASVARRMSWAARRRTARVEDQAYCLLGLFQVHMLPRYGERNNAFARLQEQIIGQSKDQSIFAWDDRHLWRRLDGLLAPDPSVFKYCSDIVLDTHQPKQPPCMITNLGLHMTTLVHPITTEISGTATKFLVITLNRLAGAPHKGRPKVVKLILLECTHYKRPFHHRSWLNDLPDGDVDLTVQWLQATGFRLQRPETRELYVQLYNTRRTSPVGKCERCLTFEEGLVSQRRHSSQAQNVRHAGSSQLRR